MRAEAITYLSTQSKEELLYWMLITVYVQYRKGQALSLLTGHKFSAAMTVAGPHTHCTPFKEKVFKNKHSNERRTSLLQKR